MDLVSVEPVEGRDPPVLLEAVLIGGQFDETDRRKARLLAGLLLEPLVQLHRVAPDSQQGFRARAVGGHQAGRVPGGAGSQLVPLEQDDLLAAHFGQVIGYRAADDPAADHDDPCIFRYSSFSRHEIQFSIAGSRKFNTD